MHTKEFKLWNLMLVILLMIALSTGLPASSFGEAIGEANKESPDYISGMERTGNTSASFTRPRSSLSPEELSFNGSYVASHYDSHYVRKVDPLAFQRPVTYARSNAAYTREGGSRLVEGPGHSNVIAGMPYYTLIYDVDPESDYCVALPNVNMGNKALCPYAVDVVYNNNANETLRDVYYDKKTSILYIARHYLEKPKSEEPLFDDRSTVAIQTSYQMPDRRRSGGEPDYGKTVPVLVFSNDEKSKEYAYQDVQVNNMLDVTTLLPAIVKNPSQYTQSDFTITLNGSYAPLSNEQFSYDPENGMIRIEESPAVLSGITIMVREKSLISCVKEKGENLLNDLYAFAADTISHKDMKALKTSSGKYIYIADDDGDLYDQMYLGWRGSYRSKDVSGSSMKYNVHTDELIEACGGAKSFMANSMNYLHAASSKSAGWAILSYAIGNDATKHPSASGTVGTGKDIKLEIPEKDGKGDPLSKYGGAEGKNTLYNWMCHYRTHLLSYSSTEKENSAGDHYQKQFVNSDGKRNGAITFAFQFPEHIKGEPSLVDTAANEANGKSGMDSTRTISLDIKTEEIDQNKTNLWLAGWCRHMDDGKTKDDGDTVYVSCIGKGTDETGRYVVLAWSSAGAYSKYEQTGGAIYKLYVEDSCGRCTLSKATEVACADAGRTTPEKKSVFRVWNTRYGSYEEAASHGSKYAQTLTQNEDKVTSGDLIKGTYRMEQTSAGNAAGVARLMTPFMFQIKAGQNVNLTESGSGNGPIVNQRYRVTLVLQKRSDDRVLRHFSNDTLKSDQIVFEIESVESAEYGTASGFKQTVTTDKEGRAIIQNLQAGYYKISETKPSPGFYLPEGKGSCTLQIGIDGTVKKTEEIGADTFAITDISDRTPSADPQKTYQITLSKNDTPQNTVLSLTKHRSFRNEAGKIEQQPQQDVEFNLYARGNIRSFDGHGEHVYYKDGTLIQGTTIDSDSGEKTYYVDGKPTTEEKYRIITDENGKWSSENTDWKYYPLTGSEASYEMQEAYIWEQGDHISFNKEEKEHLKDLWTKNNGRSATDKLNGAGEMSFQQVLNHGVDLSYRSMQEGSGNNAQKYRVSSAGYLIDDEMLRKFLKDRIISHIESDSDRIVNGISVGTISRKVRILSPSEASDISRVKDTFQVAPFDAASLTSEHISAFVNDQVPTLLTSAEVKNGNAIPASGKVVIIDTLNYSNLIPGMTYQIKGTLYDKGTGKVLRRDGEPYTSTKEFTPQRRTGQGQLSFSIDGKEAKGDIVVFEEVSQDGSIMVSHEDPEASSQTVKKILPKKSVKWKEKKTEKDRNTTPSKEKTVKKTGINSVPDTGDATVFGTALLVLTATSLFLILLLLIYYLRMRKRS